MSPILGFVEKFLILDFDGTVYPLGGNIHANEKEVEAFNNFLDIVERNKNITYGVVTARPINSLLSYFVNKTKPKFIIPAMGTEVYYYDRSNNKYIKDIEWDFLLNVNWHRKKIIEIVDKIIPENFIIKDKLYNTHENYRVTYISEIHISETKEVKLKEVQNLTNKIQEELYKTDDLDINVIYMSDNTHWYIDILPKKVDKKLVIEFITKKWGIDLPNVLVGGDSNGDAAMFTLANINAVVVGNRKPSVDEFLNNTNNEITPNIYQPYYPYSTEKEERCATAVIGAMKYFWDIE